MSHVWGKTRKTPLFYGLLAAILGTLDDFLLIDITFIYLSCKILNLIYSSNNKEMDSSIVLNLVSILQEITDEEASVEILNNLLESAHANTRQDIIQKWNSDVIPIAKEILDKIGDSFWDHDHGLDGKISQKSPKKIHKIYENSLPSSIKIHENLSNYVFYFL